MDPATTHPASPMNADSTADRVAGGASTASSSAPTSATDGLEVPVSHRHTHVRCRPILAPSSAIGTPATAPLSAAAKVSRPMFTACVASGAHWHGVAVPAT